MVENRPDRIIEILRQAGYEAYYVGGCVRDALIGRTVNDWDITTSALPEQTITCFEKIIPTGIKHGTVTVVEGGASAEVTTYRTDGAYDDGRHPRQVSFVRTLSEDLARRDFTINAMAMTPSGELVDLYGGRVDLRHKLIRCVGDPDCRFQEDALRMLRAIRFSAQLGFTVHADTLEALRRNAHHCRKISVERIRDEMEKTLLSDRPQALLDMAELGLLEGLIPEGLGDCGWIRDLPKERGIRWAALCWCWKGLDLHRLRLDRHTAGNAMAAGELPIPDSRLMWKKLMAEQGTEIPSLLAAISGDSAILQEILQSGECFSLKDLAVSGHDFPHVRGKELGILLKKLLYHVLEHPEDNQKEKLINISKNSIDYCY